MSQEAARKAAQEKAAMKKAKRERAARKAADEAALRKAAQEEATRKAAQEAARKVADFLGGVRVRVDSLFSVLVWYDAVYIYLSTCTTRGHCSFVVERYLQRANLMATPMAAT